MSDYDFRPGGSLKLKGGVADGGVVKKKKKKSKSKLGSAENEIEREKLKELLASEELVQTSSGSGRNSPSVTSSASSSRKTDAERRFEEVQKRRMEQRVAKLAKTTHKDRVADFNKNLEALSEHHDIPKVGPG